MGRPGATYLLLACTLFGCGRGFDGPRYETSHSTIVTSFEEPLCAGDLANIERHIEHVEQLLGTSLEKDIEIFLWSGLDVPKTPCPYGRNACFVRATNRVYSDFGSLEHELTHAIVEELGTPKPFFDEGVAVATEPRFLRFPEIVPSSQIDLPRDEVSYQPGGFFVRWLLETHGVEKWRSLHSGRGNRAAFQNIYGVSFDAMAEEYLLSAPWVYAPLLNNPVPSLTESEGGWREIVTLDCAQEDTFGRMDRRSTLRHLEISESGLFDFWTTADGRRPFVASLSGTESHIRE